MKTLCAAVLLTTTIIVLAPSPAGAITVELAKKCREMSFAAYPAQLAGTKKGTAAAQRQYYNDCIAKGGSMPENKDQKQSGPAPQKGH